ncbi:MAG: pilus assembly protein [Novosphingobium sp.]|nr:pilus assembly protein [Novosphingobium sp.]
MAAVEFAMWSALFFLVSLAGLDFGSFYLQRSSADEAVSAAAVSAFATRTSVNFDGMQGYVRALAGDNSLTVTTVCNGSTGTACTNSGRTCACLKNNGTYVAAASCSATCSGTGMTSGSTAGYYLQIVATKPYQTMILPPGFVMPSKIRQTATVRLQ